MSKRKQHAPEFKAKVALEALKSEATVSDLAADALVVAVHLQALGGQPPAVIYSLQIEVTQPDQQEQIRA